MPASRVVTDKDRQQLNRDLRELKEHEEEIRRAVEAKVPKADDVLATCIECQERINAFKATYFPGKP